jgi:hypothetical protein
MADQTDFDMINVFISIKYEFRFDSVPLALWEFLPLIRCGTSVEAVGIKTM